MKKLLILLFTFILFQYPVFAENVRGVWICTAANLDFPKSPTSDPQILKSETDEIIKNCADLGINTIFLQVRPSGDAIYKSSLYPYSYYLTGKQGTPPDGGFDVLDYWINKAHENGIELHAWINPYRVSAAGSTYPLADNNIAMLHPEWVREYKGGKYLDPGLVQVMQYVVEGAKELEKNYDVDGIHIDDYFYPGKDFPDSETYAKYGQGLSLEDWRRSNTYALVKALHDELDCVFGVSPCGVWANKGTMENGSETAGSSAYFDHYADTLRWARDGITDYIAPQIYWYRGYAPADYEVLGRWWSDALANCDTKLYIGLGDYRTDSFGNDVNSPWYMGNEILAQMQMNSKNNRIDGEIHFRYGSIVNNPPLYEKIRTQYKAAEENKKFCLYIYSDSFGRVIYARKDTEFSVQKCREYAPEAAYSARAVYEREKGGLKTENISCKK